MIKELKSYQRSFLMKKAHNLKPVVIIGKKGITEGIYNAIDEALDFHELIKVKFQGLKEEKRELSAEIAGKSRSLVVTIIGNIMILYRENKDPEKREIHIPGSH